MDDVYRLYADGAPASVEVGAPTDDEAHVLLQTVITKLMTMLRGRVVLIEEMGQTYLAEPDAERSRARRGQRLGARAG